MRNHQQNIPTITSLEQLWQTAPEYALESPQIARGDPSALFARTGWGHRYRPTWTRPTDLEWVTRHARCVAHCRTGGMIALLGPVGVGKTQLAAEVMRDICRKTGLYYDLADLYSEIQSTYKSGSTESERDIMQRVKATPLLVLDEVQLTTRSDFEERVLRKILDMRYRDTKSLIIIANYTQAAFYDSLPASSIDRFRQQGAICLMTGNSHRVPL